MNRYILYRFLAAILLVPSFVFFMIIYFPVILQSGSYFFFTQIRIGKNRKVFKIFKIRTMIKNAEFIKEKLMKKNEADGPVFKIKNDPRYTHIGKFLARYGLDELPQLINIIKGDMSFVGPRPLPMYEDKYIPKKFLSRYSVLPGMTSEWVALGSHYNVKFSDWMRSDCRYAQKSSLNFDIRIFVRTIQRLFS